MVHHLRGYGVWCSDDNFMNILQKHKKHFILNRSYIKPQNLNVRFKSSETKLLGELLQLVKLRCSVVVNNNTRDYTTNK